MLNNTILLSSILFSSTYLFSNSLIMVNYCHLNNNSSILSKMMNCFFLSFSTGLMIITLDQMLKELKL